MLSTLLALGVAVPLAADAPVGLSGDQLLLSWVRGEGRFESDPEFHRDFPRSPHKEDSEKFEISARCYGLREEIGAERVEELATGLRARVGAEGTPEAEARRCLYVLGRLQDPASIELLAKVVRGGERPAAVRAEAARSLGYFGARGADETFSIFGGRLRIVAHPPRPDRRATDALLAVVDAAVSDPAGVPEVVVASALRALQSHDVEDIETRALGVVERGAPPARHAAVELLCRPGSAEGTAIVCRLVTGSEHADVRRTAAQELGWTASRSAILPLLRALGDTDVFVRRSALFSLDSLEGRPLDPGRLEGTIDPEAERARWRETYGESFERYDAARARRLRTTEPGVWRLGPF